MYSWKTSKSFFLCPYSYFVSEAPPSFDAPYDPADGVPDQDPNWGTEQELN